MSSMPPVQEPDTDHTYGMSPEFWEIYDGFVKGQRLMPPPRAVDYPAYFYDDDEFYFSNGFLSFFKEEVGEKRNKEDDGEPRTNEVAKSVPANPISDGKKDKKKKRKRKHKHKHKQKIKDCSRKRKGKIRCSETRETKSLKQEGKESAHSKLLPDEPEPAATAQKKLCEDVSNL